MNGQIIIPKGCLAADDAALAAKRAALKAKLLSGEKINLKPGTGDAVQGGGSDSSISIPVGKLAAGNVAQEDKRAALKAKLLTGGKISIKIETGNVVQGEDSDSSIRIHRCKLGSHWYEANPSLLQAEKAAMAHCFPGFELGKLDDGRLYWLGELAPGVYENKFGRKKSYHVMAVYPNNHPVQGIGSSVYVYLVVPEIDDIVKECGFCPFRVLRDADGEVFLCTIDADYAKDGNTVITAASALACAVKWLLAYELVLTGDLSREELNEI